MTAAEITRTPVVDFIVNMEKLKRFDCLPNNTLVPLVNEGLKSLLENFCANEVQFFPALLHCKDGIFEGYYFLNATQTFMGIDRENSVYQTFPDSEDILGFDFLTYKPNCMKTLKIARDIEYRGNLVVNETIHKLFIQEKIKGVKLYKPEDFYKPLCELL